jgi:hypothetical protein
VIRIEVLVGPSARPIRRLVGLTLALGLGVAAVLGARMLLAGDDLTPVAAGASDRTAPTAVARTAPTSTSTTTATTAPVTPVVTPPTAPAFDTGNPQLDALLPTLPPRLFDGGATVHYGWNPLDTCCHAGGFNPASNDVWIGQSAFASPARLTYVTAHELAHSVHLKTTRSAALSAAVAGAPVVRAGPWDTSEKVADCVAWVLFPAQTAASGITYWSCPDPWRSQVRAALG